MDDEQEAARDPSTIVHNGTDNLPAIFQTENAISRQVPTYKTLGLTAAELQIGYPKLLHHKCEGMALFLRVASEFSNPVLQSSGSLRSEMTPGI